MSAPRNGPVLRDAPPSADMVTREAFGSSLVHGPLGSEGVHSARQIIGHHSKSFALASRILPPGASAEVAVVYSWCRRVDDAVDLARTHDESRRSLARERRVLAELYGATTPEDPVLAAFQGVVRRRAIPLQVPHELLEGMAMDVEGRRYRSLDELVLYCFRVAGTVGLMMSHVLGVSDVRALKQAAHLGIAMQLTNICRDVLEDWGRGRLYLPAALLAEVGLGELDPSPGVELTDVEREGLARVIARLLALADLYYRSGEQGLPALSWRSALAVRSARLIYADIGRLLARRGHDVFSGRAVVSTPRKLWLVLRALTAALTELPRRWRSPFERAALPRIVTIHELLSL